VSGLISTEAQKTYQTYRT